MAHDGIKDTEPRVELVVDHQGIVSIHTCDECTGTPEQLLEVLETVLANYPWDHGRIS